MNRLIIPKLILLDQDGKPIKLPSETKERKRRIRHQGEKEKARRLRQIERKNKR